MRLLLLVVLPVCAVSADDATQARKKLDALIEQERVAGARTAQALIETLTANQGFLKRHGALDGHRPPVERFKVIGVHGKQVVIEPGRDSGVRIGTILTVRRKGRFAATIRIHSIGRAGCTGELVRKGPAYPPKAKDTVSYRRPEPPGLDALAKHHPKQVARLRGLMANHDINLAKLREAKHLYESYRKIEHHRIGKLPSTKVDSTLGPDLVVLPIGSKQGLREGDRYRLRRGADYVGTADVVVLFEKRAVLRLDTSLAGPAAPAQPGDVAEPGE